MSEQARKQRAKQWLRSTVGEPYVGKRLKLRRLSRVLRQLSLAPERILEFGSGDGAFVYWLARRYPGAKVTAVDIDPSLIEACRAARSARYAARVQFELGSSGDLPDDTFDLITALDVLEHIEDDAQALEQLAGALRPGGTLLVHVPRDRWRTRSGELHHPAPEQVAEINPGHVRHGYDPESLRGLLSGAGLTVQAIETWLGPWGVLAYETYARLERPRPLRLLSLPATDLFAYLDARRPRPEGNSVFARAVKPA